MTQKTRTNIEVDFNTALSLVTRVTHPDVTPRAVIRLIRAASPLPNQEGFDYPSANAEFKRYLNSHADAATIALVNQNPRLAEFTRGHINPQLEAIEKNYQGDEAKTQQAIRDFFSAAQKQVLGKKSTLTFEPPQQHAVSGDKKVMRTMRAQTKRFAQQSNKGIFQQRYN